MERTDVLVVGGGIAGLAAAWQLAAREGARVVLLERERTLGAHSSGRNAAILRTLTESALGTELALEGARFLAAPPADFCERPLLEPVGLALLLSDPPPPALEDWRRRKAPGSVRELDDAEFSALAPGLCRGAGRALLVRDEGRIDIAALLDGFARGARGAGAVIRTGARVAALLRSGSRVEGVQLADGATVEAGCVLLAAGGWAGELGRHGGSRIALRVTRRHLLVTAPDARIDPRAPVLWSDPDGFYARPESGGLLACACDESEVLPDASAPDEAVRVAIAREIARIFPALADVGAAHFWAGLRTFAPDREFLIGPDPDLAGLFWIAGLGGHGMSCASAAGRLAALHVTGQASADPLAARVSPLRFADASSAAARPARAE